MSCRYCRRESLDIKRPGSTRRRPASPAETATREIALFPLVGGAYADRAQGNALAVRFGREHAGIEVRFTKARREKGSEDAKVPNSGQKGREDAQPAGGGKESRCNAHAANRGEEALGNPQDKSGSDHRSEDRQCHVAGHRGTRRAYRDCPGKPPGAN